VSRSIICEGCIVDGYVEHSVLSPGVHVEEGAVIRDSIIFDDAHIEHEAVLTHSIVDKEVRIGRGSQLGWGDDYAPNKQDPAHLNTGITVVGKRASLPAGLRVGRNCKIAPGVQEEDFESQLIASGETIVGKRGLRALF
jgi:glucose-1-phosphate adenylyltransferase